MSEKTRRSRMISIFGNLQSLWGKSLLLICIFISGCIYPGPQVTQTHLDPAGVFPAANSIPGWDISQKVETYNRENLFNLVDGQADSFFAYGFEQVSVQRYQNSAAILLNIEIWQLATPADAYGLFSAGRTGATADVGIDGDSDPGRRLAFWQNRYFVSLNTAQPVPDEDLQAFARAIVGRLPAGGARPALVDRLPPSGLVGQALIFFHEEISIQMEIWLGGENILGLSQATNGVVGRYELGQTTARLMLVEYPVAGQAAKGLNALKNSAVTDVLAADARGNLLGAVFGKADVAQAQALLQDAMK